MGSKSSQSTNYETNTHYDMSDHSVTNITDGGAFDLVDNVTGEAFDSINQLTEGMFGALDKFTDGFTQANQANTDAIVDLAKSNATNGATDLMQAGAMQNNTMMIVGGAVTIAVLLLTFLASRT